MALPTPASTIEWSSVIRDALLPQLTASIEVWDPKSRTSTPYDPVTDTGGTTTPVLVMAARPASIQQVRYTVQSAGADGWGTKRYYRFQIELIDGDPLVSEGYEIHVIDGGNDPSLVTHRFQVLASGDSSFAALRDIEAVTDFGVAGTL